MTQKNNLSSAVFWTAAALSLVATMAWSILGKHHHTKRREAETERHVAQLTTKQTQEAQALFTKTCAACHGQHLEGAIGPSLIQIDQRHSVEKIERIIRSGKGKQKDVAMPGGLASDDEAALLAQWLSRRASL
jgi:mono/diheme cytochrome c family protein